MKTIFATLAALLVSVSAFAADLQVGTTANYTVTATQAGATMTGALNYVVTGYTATTNMYQVQSTFTSGAGSQVQLQDIDGKNLNIGPGILSNCAMYGGTLESVTVAAGTFSTCHLVNVDAAQNLVGHYWVGDVAFNFVKLVETEGPQTTTMELAN